MPMMDIERSMYTIMIAIMVVHIWTLCELHFGHRIARKVVVRRISSVVIWVLFNMMAWIFSRNILVWIIWGLCTFWMMKAIWNHSLFCGACSAELGWRGRGYSHCPKCGSDLTSVGIV